MKLLSRSETETFDIGKNIGKNLGGGDIVLLSGFLGAGKTVFTKGIAAGLGIKEEILSPTFTIMCEYQAAGNLTFCHIDAYRLKNEREASEAGIDEVFGAPGAVTVVEWHENIAGLFKNRNCRRIKIITAGETQREIEIDDE